MTQAPLLDPPLPLLPGGFDLHTGYLSAIQAGELMHRLLTDLPWARPELTVWGKSHRIPRCVHWQGDPGTAYCYSGLHTESSPWHPWVRRLRDKLREDTGLNFNSALVNLYRNGDDKMGWHADDEPELGPRPLIASVSLGAQRDFRIRPKDKSGPAINIALPPGSLLIMHEGTQATWEHCVPIRRKVKEPRINLTFRHVQKGWA